MDICQRFLYFWLIETTSPISPEPLLNVGFALPVKEIVKEIADHGQ
jgi:hypothetical protein